MRRFFHAALWIAAVGAAVATFGGYYELKYPPSDEEATIFVPIFLIGGSFIFFVAMCSVLLIGFIRCMDWLEKR